MVWRNVADESGVTLALRIGGTACGRGERASIRLRNVTDRIVNTGNSRKYAIEVYTESGWQDVRVGDADEEFEYTDEYVDLDITAHSLRTDGNIDGSGPNRGTRSVSPVSVV